MCDVSSLEVCRAAESQERGWIQSVEESLSYLSSNLSTDSDHQVGFLPNPSTQKQVDLAEDPGRSMAVSTKKPGSHFKHLAFTKENGLCWKDIGNRLLAF